MDTQGSFDNESSMNQCATIFALSTLISSVQVYNLSHLVHEPDLTNLQLFTEYGRLAMDKGGKSAFQKLLFLVRDWQNKRNYPYGASGGRDYINEVLKVTICKIVPSHNIMMYFNLQQKETRNGELKSVRAHINKCFEEVSCFLMPHPGLPVATDDSGDIKGKVTAF
jgi:atlastin